MFKGNTTQKAAYIEELYILRRKFKDSTSSFAISDEVELVQQRILDLLDSTAAELEIM